MSLTIICRCAAAALMATFLIAAPAGRACNEVITWSADLTGANEKPAIDTQAGGKATFVMDFENPKATITVDTKNLKDVERIELRASQTFGDVNGPPILTIYDAKSGPLPASLSIVATDADIIKQTTPKVASIADVAGVVVNGQSAVVVCTKTHPGGEIAGRISMHKSAVYSNDPNSRFHNPALHKAHAQPGA